MESGSGAWGIKKREIKENGSSLFSSLFFDGLCGSSSATCNTFKE